MCALLLGEENELLTHMKAAISVALCSFICEFVDRVGEDKHPEMSESKYLESAPDSSVTICNMLIFLW
jgi:hypothetical protein